MSPEFLNKQISLTRKDLFDQREQIQNDITRILDGLDDDIVDRVCQVVVDRFDILLRKESKI